MVFLPSFLKFCNYHYIVQVWGVIRRQVFVFPEKIAQRNEDKLQLFDCKARGNLNEEGVQNYTLKGLTEVIIYSVKQ